MLLRGRQRMHRGGKLDVKLVMSRRVGYAVKSRIVGIWFGHVLHCRVLLPNRTHDWVWPGILILTVVQTFLIHVDQISVQFEGCPGWHKSCSPKWRRVSF